MAAFDESYEFVPNCGIRWKTVKTAKPRTAVWPDPGTGYLFVDTQNTFSKECVTCVCDIVSREQVGAAPGVTASVALTECTPGAKEARFAAGARIVELDNGEAFALSHGVDESCLRDVLNKPSIAELTVYGFPSRVYGGADLYFLGVATDDNNHAIYFTAPMVIRKSDKGLSKTHADLGRRRSDRWPSFVIPNLSNVDNDNSLRTETMTSTSAVTMPSTGTLPSVQSFTSDDQRTHPDNVLLALGAVMSEVMVLVTKGASSCFTYAARLFAFDDGHPRIAVTQNDVPRDHEVQDEFATQMYDNAFFASDHEATTSNPMCHQRPWDIEVGNVLGRGACGEVRAARYRGTRAVVKTCTFFGAPTETNGIGFDRIYNEIAREASMLFNLRSSYIVNIFGVVVADGFSGLLLERLLPVEGIIIRSDFPTPRALYLTFLADIVLALQYLHGHGVVHRDLKPSNTLFDSNRKVFKISDLGEAKIAAFTNRAVVGTLHYMAPECFTIGATITTAADRFSFGVMAIDMMNGRTHGHLENYQHGQDSTLALQATLNDEDLTEIIKGLVHADPVQRPPFDSVIHALQSFRRRVGLALEETLPDTDNPLTALVCFRSIVDACTEDECDRQFAVDATSRVVDTITKFLTHGAVVNAEYIFDMVGMGVSALAVLRSLLGGFDEQEAVTIISWIGKLPNDLYSSVLELTSVVRVPALAVTQFPTAGDALSSELEDVLHDVDDFFAPAWK